MQQKLSYFRKLVTEKGSDYKVKKPNVVEIASKVTKGKKWFDELFGVKMAKSTFSRVKKNEEGMQ